MFRRRRSEDADRDEFDNDEPEQPAGVSRAEGGPWDAEESFPDLERVDLGSLQVPIGPEHEIQLVMAEQHGAWVTVRHQESEVQIQAFAASRRGALWDDVRAEIAAEVQGAGGQSQESEGSFGTELIAQVPAEPGQPERFDYEYTRNGTANLFMLSEPLTGRRHVEVTDRRCEMEVEGA